MAGLPDWFLSKNVRTPKDLENEKPRLSILNPQEKVKKDEYETDKSPSSELNNGDCEYAVSQYLYEEAYDTVASTFVRNAQNHLQAPKGSVVFNCKMDGGMEVLDALVHRLAKDLESSLITLEFEDLLDLGWELDHRENRSTGWTLEEKSLKLESPDRQTPLGPAHHYFAVRSHRKASREAWSRSLRAFSSILDCSRVEESSRKAPVMIHVRDAMRVMEESEGSRILARLRDCVEKKQQSGKAITIVATLSHFGTTEDDCDCWICDEKNMYSGYDESSRRSYNRFEKFKRKIGATSASTITVDAPHVSVVKEKGDFVANLNIRHLKRLLRLRISNCFAVDTLLPDADWMEDFGPESFGESIWTEEEIEKAVARIKGRAWKKPLLDLDDVQVVLKLLGMLLDGEKSSGGEHGGDESSGGEHGGGGHLDKKWKKRLEDTKDTCNDHENELIDGDGAVMPERLHSKFDDFIKRLGTIPDGEKSGDGEHGDDKSSCGKHDGDESSGGEYGDGGHLDKKLKTRLEDIKDTCNDHEIELIDGVVMPEDLHSKFDDVIIDEEVKETIKFLTSVSKFRAETTSHFLLSQLQIKGALLYGPPGTGKTHFSRAIAKESGASMLAIDGAQIHSTLVGETEKYIKAAFTLATKLAPCVLFIDEADSLFRRRSSEDKSWERSSITQFLTSMDNIRQKETGDAPFVLVATNRPMDLDDAFLRRLPQKAMIGLPSKESRSKILRLFVTQDDLDPETDIDSIAEQTDGYSGSDLRSLCAKAALLWAIEQQQNKDEKEESPAKVKLTNYHFDRALDNIRPAVSKQALRELEEFDRRFNARSRKPKKTKDEKTEISDESSANRNIPIETRAELVLRAVNETPSDPALPHSVAECLDFVYEPLENTQFRVLKIHPGATGAPLEADLVHASLTDAPQYQALSYTRGSPEPPFYMSCNGVEMRITKSLHDALCNARKEGETLTIWADAVCINQKDVAEKSVQVALMREIYARANGLFIWIGQPEDPDDAKLVAETFDGLESLFLRILDAGAWRITDCLSDEGKTAVFSKISEEFGWNAGDYLESLEPCQWTTFYQFFLMPWFTSVWIYQEVTSIPRAFEDEITLAYGNAKISWPRFAVVTRGLMLSQLDMASKMANFPVEQSLTRIFELIELERTSHWINLKLPDETLDEDRLCQMIEYAVSNQLRPRVVAEYDMEAFEKATDRQAEQDRYKSIVYGAFERCKSPSHNTPPIISKYRNFFLDGHVNGGREGRLFPNLDLSRRLCSTDARDKLFAFCGILNEEIGSESNERLASNYRKSAVDVFVDLTLYFVKEELCLDIFELLPDQVETDESLKIEGLPSWAVDLTRAPKAERMQTSASVSANGSNDCGFSSHALTVVVSDDRRQLELSVYILSRVERLVPPAQERSIPYKEILQSLSEMQRLATADGNVVSDPLVWAKEATYVTGGTVYEAFWRTAACTGLAMAPVGSKFAAFWRTSFDQWHEQMWRTLYGSEDDEGPREEHPQLNFEERNFHDVGSKPFSAHRQFCVTERGFMGWVPQRARVGDAVCIVPGARMPYLIRPTGIAEQWELVGPAYVHGVMQGLFNPERDSTHHLLIDSTLTTKGEELLGSDEALRIFLV